MTATGRNRRIPKKENLIRRGLLRGSLALLAGTFLLANCSGNTNSSGPAAPLPTGQTGSIAAVSANTGNCYVSDNNYCGTITEKGTNPITALATYTSGTTDYLYTGDGAGSISYWTVTSSTAPTTGITTCTTGTTNKILTIAAGNSTVLFATSGGITKFSGTFPACTTPSSLSTSIANTSGLTYNSNASEFIGVTSNAQYFTCSTTSCTSPAALPNLQDTSPNITAIASDPSNPIVYILSIGNSTNRIYYYSVSGNTLTYQGNYSGNELNYPSGITLFRGYNPTQNYCTSGYCTFMDVTNTGNDTITQYVLTYPTYPNPGNGTQTTVSSINQFNNAYFDCDLINSAAIAAFPNYSTTTNLLPQPDVFVGEQGTSYGSCLGTSSTASYGNNVTAYTIVGE